MDHGLEKLGLRQLGPIAAPGRAPSVYAVCTDGVILMVEDICPVYFNWLNKSNSPEGHRFFFLIWPEPEVSLSKVRKQSAAYTIMKLIYI